MALFDKAFLKRMMRQLESLGTGIKELALEIGPNPIQSSQFFMENSYVLWAHPGSDLRVGVSTRTTREAPMASCFQFFFGVRGAGNDWDYDSVSPVNVYLDIHKYFPQGGALFAELCMHLGIFYYRDPGDDDEVDVETYDFTLQRQGFPPGTAVAETDTEIDVRQTAINIMAQRLKEMGVDETTLFFLARE